MFRKIFAAGLCVFLCTSLSAKADISAGNQTAEHQRSTSTREAAEDLQPDCPLDGPASCLKAFTDKSDARLNRVYQALLRQLDARPEVRDALIASERAWITFRDANCRVSLEYYRGSAHDYMMQRCLFRLTSQRAEELRKFAETDRALTFSFSE
jgi:uncharacterized protein YecT (DUF1311 family)